MLPNADYLPMIRCWFARCAVSSLFLCISIVAFPQPSPPAALVGGIAHWQVVPREDKEGRIPFIALQPGELLGEVIRVADNLKVASQTYAVASAPQALAIEKIPVGGDYTVIFRSGTATQAFEHILVGEIWVVGGGSNAYGSEGDLEPSIPQVRMFRGQWMEGQDPFFPPGYIGAAPGKAIVTPWLRAARNYYQRTGIPVGVMGFCAPNQSIGFFLNASGTESPLFRRLIEQYGKGASVFCWFQGEADTSLDLSRSYKDRLKALTGALRRYSGNPQMLVVVVQLSHFLQAGMPASTGFGDIRESQRQYCMEDPNSILIPSLPYAHRDALHLNADGLRQVGSRIAQALDEARNNSGRPLWQGPRIASARIVGTLRRRVEVKFEGAKRLILTSDPDEMGDPQDRWKTQWLVSDAKHQGFPRLFTPEVRDGSVYITLSGGTFGPTSTEQEGHVLQAHLENSGFLQPMAIALDGVTINIDLPDGALPGAMLHFAYLDGSKGYLTDERGKPAAAFGAIPISEP